MTVRQIHIGGHLVGIVDLNETFENVSRMAIAEESRLKDVLLEEVRKKNYVPSALEEAYRDALLEEYRVFTGAAPARGQKRGPTEIRVYGPGCPRCKQMDQLVRDVLASKDVAADYRYVTDIREIAEKGVLRTPFLTVNGKVLVSGRVPTKAELEKLILDATGLPSGGPLEEGRE